MASIILVNGSVSQVDDTDYLKLAGYRWLQAQGYAVTYVKLGERWYGKLMHIVIFDEAYLNTTVPRKTRIDHCDGDKLNNRRGNLRAATATENGQHRIGASKRSKTGCLGVSFDEHRQRYVAAISYDGKQHPLGRFKTLEEALAVRVAAERKQFGEFAPKRS